MVVVTTLTFLGLRKVVKQEFVSGILLLPSITPFSCPGGSVSFSFPCFHRFFTGPHKQSQNYSLPSCLDIVQIPPRTLKLPLHVSYPMGLLPVFHTVPRSWTTATGQKMCCDILYIFISRPCDIYITTFVHFTEMKFLPSFLTETSV